MSATSAQQAHIRQEIENRVRKDPDGDVNYFDILTELGDPGISVEMVTGALRRLAEDGLLVVDRREKVPRAEAKDRKVIQYRATEKFQIELGLMVGGELGGDPELSGLSQSPSAVLGSIHAYVEAHGFVCSAKEIANYFLCLQAKPFVILSGISGTGKTRLPRMVAEAIGAAHELIPVKPNWSDNSDLMGFFSVSVNDFVPGRMLEFIRTAVANPGLPHFVVLDEMNLAHVEHYLSDVLSIAETRRRNPGGGVTTDPLPLDLPTLPNGTLASADRWTTLRSVELPWNLFFVGTVNVDETTHPFSRKVLDRANAIDFSDVDLTRFGAAVKAHGNQETGKAYELFLDRPLSVQEVYSESPEFFGKIALELAEFNECLRPADLHFAYRVRDEIALYMWAWNRHDLSSILPRDEAFDFCILQKILPRCQGSSETGRRALEGVFRLAAREILVEGEQASLDALTAALPTAPPPLPDDIRSSAAPLDPRQVVEPAGAKRWRYPRTARKVLRMLRRYIDTGYFAFWS